MVFRVDEADFIARTTWQIGHAIFAVRICCGRRNDNAVEHDFDNPACARGFTRIKDLVTIIVGKDHARHGAERMTDYHCHGAGRAIIGVQLFTNLIANDIFALRHIGRNRYDACRRVEHDAWVRGRCRNRCDDFRRINWLTTQLVIGKSVDKIGTADALPNHRRRIRRRGNRACLYSQGDRRGRAIGGVELFANLIGDRIGASGRARRNRNQPGCRINRRNSSARSNWDSWRCDSGDNRIKHNWLAIEQIIGESIAKIRVTQSTIHCCGRICRS